MIFLALAVIAAAVGAVGGSLVTLWVLGVIEWTSRPEDELARRDRRLAR